MGAAGLFTTHAPAPRHRPRSARSLTILATTLLIGMAVVPPQVVTA
jgi:hypothetical protein